MKSVCRTATNKQYRTLWHVTKKGSPEEPPCVQVESIRVRWWWLEVENVIAGWFWSVKLDMSIVGIAGKTCFQRINLDARQFIGEKLPDELGLYIPGISVVKAEPHGDVPDEMLEGDGLKPVI